MVNKDFSAYEFIRARIVWEDNRLSYAYPNIKKRQTNKLTDAEKNEIWRPTVNFEVVSDTQFRLMEDRIFVRPIGNPLAVIRNGSVYEEIFEGAKSELKEIKLIKGGVQIVDC